jgi:carotenoid cleavage dioxygenase-like enzyme
MATLTGNLFRGQGERDHRLEVVEGHWPDDVTGSVLIVGPDSRAPGRHWFGAPGLIEQIRLVPGSDGRIEVRHRAVRTPVARWRERFGFLFARVQFLELSPFGVTNLANTNLQAIDGRLFVGYDAGRPIEVDPVTLEVITAVGHNDEWLQAAPGLYEPLCAVAAHPAPDHDEHALWFVNYTQVAAPGEPKETWLARWPLDGPVRRWRVEGMSSFDSIHDIKATEHHLVFSDLPFVVEPDSFRGRPRQVRNQTHTNLWIVSKAEVAATPPGGSVAALEVHLPIPTGHLYVDHEERDGTIRVAVQHSPTTDLMIQCDEGEWAGLVALAVQPSVVGRYVIDAATGEVLDGELAMDVERMWGGILPAVDDSTPAARARHRTLWYVGAGYDPELVPDEWRRLYAGATDAIVAPEDLPDHAIAGSVARVDLESMKVAEVWSYEDGAFPSPPTFVPRVGAEDPDDGYLLVVVHQDGDKEVQVFDALHLERGPLARATAPGFSPSLLLHSTWMADRVGPRPSAYRVRWWRDVVGALAGLPGVLARMARMVVAVARQSRAAPR